MREFKFRAWDKVDEKWIEMRRMGFLENGESWYVEDYEENEPPYFTDRDNWILMQYTGLNDCNGVDIYEGDIVKKDNGSVIICFNSGIFGFYKDVKVSFFNDETQSVFYSLYSISDEKLEVIGNICEQDIE